jgi:hypothetical protein
MLFSSTLLGKADFMITPLLNQSSMHEMVQLKKAQTRKVIGEIELSISLRRPLLQDEIIQVNTRVVLPASEATTTTTTTTSPPTTTTTTTSVPAKKEVLGTPKPSPAPVKNTTTAAVVDPKKTTVPSNKPATTTTTTSAPPVKHEEEEDDENSPYNPESFVSCAVMEWWISELSKKGKSLSADEQDQLDHLKMKLNILQTQVEAGILEPDKYLQIIQHRINVDRAAAKALMLKQRKDLATFALKKSKIMEKEATELSEQLSQMQ